MKEYTRTSAKSTSVEKCSPSGSLHFFPVLMLHPSGTGGSAAAVAVASAAVLPPPLAGGATEGFAMFTFVESASLEWPGGCSCTEVSPPLPALTIDSDVDDADER